MTSQIKQRIEQIRRGEVPEGYKRTKVGIVPIEWEDSRFKRLFSRLTRKNTENNNNVLTISAQYGLINQSDFFNKSIASDDKTNYFLLHRGDFAYNKSYSNGYPFGALKRLDEYDKGIVSPLYICFSSSDENQCPEFYLQYFEAGYINREIHAIAQEGARNHGLLNISVDDFFNSYLLMPPIAEQQKIAEILSAQDKLIELEQRKIEELKKAKKYYLSKMFPKKGSSVPEIRFTGFTAPWEQRKLGDFFDMTIPNNTLSRAELTYDGGEVQSVHYGDVLIKYGAFIDAQADEVPYITGGKVSDYKAHMLQDGDIIFADTAEDETTGKAAEIGNLQGKAVVAGLHTIVCRPSEKVATYYLGYYLNSNSFHSQLLPLMQGIKVLSLSRSNLSQTEIMFPASQDEQAAIGGFFHHLDHLITLHQRKCEELKRHKKALMQLFLTGIVRVNI